MNGLSIVERLRETPAEQTSVLELRAIAWASKNMCAGQYADDCHWVRSGWAVHGMAHNANACTCRAVPKSYAPFLTASAIEARAALAKVNGIGEGA